jgi:hypothetical protein
MEHFSDGGGMARYVGLLSKVVEWHADVNMTIDATMGLGYRHPSLWRNA